MAKVLLVYENDIPFLYQETQDGEIKKRRLDWDEATSLNFQKYEIKRLEPNSPEHLEYLKKYIGDTKLNPLLVKNFLAELSNPLDNFKFSQILLNTMFYYQGNIDEDVINTVNLINKEIKNDIPDSAIYQEESEILAHLLTQQPFLLKQSIENPEKCNLILNTFSNPKSVLKIIPYLDNSDGYQLFIQEYNDLLDEQSFETLKEIYFKCAKLDNNNLGSYYTNKPNYNINIYLNIPDKELLYKILKDYAISCINLNIDYEIRSKYLTDYDKVGSSILLSDNRTLLPRIKILEQLALKYPQLLTEKIEPPLNTAKFGSGYYGISYKPKKYSYDDVFFTIAEIAYTRVVAILLLKNGIKFEINDNTPIMSLINLEAINYENGEYYFADEKFETIKNELQQIIKLHPDYQEKIANDIKNSSSANFFRETMLMLHNYTYGYDETRHSNIALNPEIETYFSKMKEKVKEAKKEIKETRIPIENKLVENQAPTEKINVDLQKFLKPNELTSYQKYLEIYNNHAKEENPVVLDVNDNGEVIFPTDTLLHSVYFREIDSSKLHSIKKFGIITNQLQLKSNDQSDFGCVDFFKIKFPMTLSEYQDYYRERVDSRKIVQTKESEGPLLNKSLPKDNNKTLMFVLNGLNSEEIALNHVLTSDKPYNQRIKEILSKQSTQNRYAHSLNEVISVPVGVPSNYIVGIVVGGLCSKYECETLKGIFPNAMLISPDGKVLSEIKQVGRKK